MGPALTKAYQLRACDGCSHLVGLVPVTNCYHLTDLGRIRPREAFTNHYRRGQGLGIDLSVGEVVWVIIAYNDGEP